MKFSDLKTYYPHKFIEFELRLERVDALCIEEFIDIISSDIVLVKKSDEENSEYIHGVFVTKKYQNEFDDHSHGKYYCQIIEKLLPLKQITAIHQLDMITR